MKDLTKREIKELPWVAGEKWGLVNRETKDFVFTSDKIEHCHETLRKMTPRHPEFQKLQLVERPKS